MERKGFHDNQDGMATMEYSHPTEGNKNVSVAEEEGTPVPGWRIENSRECNTGQ